MKKNKQKIFILGLTISMILLTILLLGGANGASVIAPTAGSNHTKSSSPLFNCSSTGVNTIFNITNATFYYNLSGAQVPILQILNTSPNTNGSLSSTISLASVTAGLGYKISCQLCSYNGSCDNSTVNVTGVGFYTNNPTCAFDTSKDTVEYMNAIGIETTQSATNDTLSSIVYSWILYDTNTNSQQTSTSLTPTFSGSDFDEIGTFTLALTVTDSLGNSAVCTNKSLFVKGADGDASAQIIVQTTQQEGVVSNLTFWIIGIVVILVLLTAVSFYAISQAKKR